MALFTAAGVAAALGSIGVTVSATGFFATASAFILNATVGIGVNLLASAVAGKPPKPTFSVNGTIASGGDVPRSFIFGRYATAGSLVWANTWGQSGDIPNIFLTQVIAVSDLPVSGLAEVWVNGEKCTLITNEPGPRGYPVQQYRKDGQDSLFIKFYDGTQTTADSFLVSDASTGARPYESTRVGRGIAYVIATARVTKNMFSGFPTFKFVVDGVKFYDITKDSSAGGDGPQRFGDPSSWGGDGDHLPAVLAYNLLRGIRWDGEWFYGLQGMTEARLPAANWLAQIGKCRAPIEGASGLEPTYRCGGELTVDAPLSAALEAVNASCQGRISEVGGFYSMFLGAPDAPSFSFTDDDILSTEEQSFTPFFGLADTINGIAARYPSPNDGWVMKPAPALYRSDLEARHGNRRLMADPELALVPYPEQVQRLQSSALAEGQRARRHTMVLPPSFWPYAVPGAVCSVGSERNGYSSKLFRVDGAVDRANLDVMIDITEIDPDDFDWNSDTDYDPPVDGPVGPIRPQPAPIIDWFAEPWVVTNGSDVRPGLKLTWDGSRSGVAGVEFQVRLASTLEVVHQGRTDDAAAGAVIISQNLFSNTLYGVRGRYIFDSEQEALWSDWLAVTTPDARNTDISATLSSLSAGVKKTLQDLFAQQNTISAQLEHLALNASEAAGTIAKESSVAVRYRNATAAAMRTMTASIEAKTRVYRQALEPAGPVSDGDMWVDTDDGNLVRVWNASISEWEETGAKGLQTFAQDEEPTASGVGDLWVDTDDDFRLYRWDGDEWVDISDERITAQAEIIDAISAQVGNISADGLRKIEVVAGSGDVVARLVDMVRATIADDFVQAGFVIEVGFAGGNPAAPFGRMVLSAPQVMVADEEGNVSALFDAEGAHFRNAFIGTLTGDHIAFNTLTGDHIEVGSIDSPSLAFGAVTEYTDLAYYEFLELDGGDSVSTDLRNVLTATVTNPTGTPLIIFINLRARRWNASGSGATAAGIFLDQDGVEIGQAQNFGSVGNGQQQFSSTLYVPADVTSTTFELFVGLGGNVGGSSGQHLEVQSRSGVLRWKK